MFQFSLPTLCLLSLLSPIVASVCYDIYGNEQKAGFLPCPNYNGGASMCCALGRDIDPGTNTDNSPTRDICLPNGLCQNISVNHTSSDNSLAYQYYWDFCSSKDWGDGCLPDVCNVTNDGYGQLTPCADTPHTTKWCCEQNSTECCNAWPNHRAAVTLALTLGQSASKTSSSMSNTATASSRHTTTNAAGGSSSITPAPTPTSTTSTSSSGLSTGAQAGIGVGAALGGLAIIAAAVFAVRRVMRARKEEESVDAVVPTYYAKIAPSESDGHEVGHEVESQVRHELPAT